MHQLNRRSNKILATSSIKPITGTPNRLYVDWLASFDCSGLTQWCYGKAGISLPRTAQAQYDATQHIPLSQAQAGDLVFFHSTYNTSDYVTHVGIYAGNHQMYHAGNPIGYTDLTSAYWQQHIICAGRIKQ